MSPRRLGVLISVWLCICAPPTSAAPAPTTIDAARITLDLKGVELVDVLQLFSQQSHLNFVASPTVAGPVTMFVHDVLLWDAFELLVASHNLAYEQRGDLISVMGAQEYETRHGARFRDPRATDTIVLQSAKAAHIAGALTQLKSDDGRVIVDEPSNTVIVLDVPARVAQLKALAQQLDVATATRVWEPRYTPAANLPRLVQELLTPGLGTAAVDERSNQLIVTDVPAVIARIDTLVQAVDTKTRQVLIEAKIVQVNLSDSRTMGIDWKAVLNALDAETRGQFDSLGDILGGAAKGWTLQYRAGGVALTALLEALQSVGRTEIISSPSIAVTDRQEAKILVGTKEAFVTTTVVSPGGGSPATSAEQVTFVDVGVQLAVTPTITPDGFVQLKIRPEVSSVEREIETSQGNTIPIVKTSEADTSLLLKHGTTIMIGGLIEDRAEQSRDQLPWLGNVPVLKYAFGSRKDATKKTETVIFLTPYIVAGDESLLELAHVRERSPSAARRLQDDGVVPPDYRAALQAYLAPVLAAACPDGPPTPAILTITLRRDGTLDGEVVVEGAAGPNCRRQWQEALQAASPLPAVPPGVPAGRLTVRIPIEYAEK